MAFLLNTANVKFSVNVARVPRALEKIRTLFKSEITAWGNYFVRRLKYTYIIFLNGHINVTGVRSLAHLKDVRDEVRHLLSVPKNNPYPKLEDFKVDNICARGKTGLEFISLRETERNLRLHIKF
ncbi:MAG: hypothetical protein AAGE99_06125, partial [Chlamydiota bacterium]